MEKKGSGEDKGVRNHFHEARCHVRVSAMERHRPLRRIKGVGSLKWVQGNNYQSNSLNVAKRQGDRLVSGLSPFYFLLAEDLLAGVACPGA